MHLVAHLNVSLIFVVYNLILNGIPNSQGASLPSTIKIELSSMYTMPPSNASSTSAAAENRFPNFALVGQLSGMHTTPPGKLEFCVLCPPMAIKQGDLICQVCRVYKEQIDKAENARDLKHLRPLLSLMQPIDPLIIFVLSPAQEEIFFTPFGKYRSSKQLVTELAADFGRKSTSSIYFNGKVLIDSQWQDNIPLSATDIKEDGEVDVESLERITRKIQFLNSTEPHINKYILQNLDQAGILTAPWKFFSMIFNQKGIFYKENPLNFYLDMKQQSGEDRLHCIAYFCGEVDFRNKEGVSNQNPKHMFQLQTRIEYTVFPDRAGNLCIGDAIITLGVQFRHRQFLEDGTGLNNLDRAVRWIHEKLVISSVQRQPMLREIMAYHQEQDRKYSHSAGQSFYVREHAKMLDFLHQKFRNKLIPRSPEGGPEMFPLSLQDFMLKYPSSVSPSDSMGFPKAVSIAPSNE
jgi:hypothetical protein